MSIFKVKVKWGKEVFPDIELNKDDPPMLFRAQVFALTGVQPSRQKVMIKGTTVKEGDWGDVKIKDGSLVLIMGSKDEDITPEPTERPKFIEDMSEEEANRALDLPVGITNLGNTCYLNSVLQCLKVIPEVYSSIKNFEAKGKNRAAESLTSSLQDMFQLMDSGKTAIPVIFVEMFRSTFPRFAEQQGEGKYVQQDASECWTELVRMFENCLPPITAEGEEQTSSKSVISQFFTGKSTCTWTCDEDQEEEVKVTQEDFSLLMCHISQDVKYLHTGLAAKMEEKITKRSEKLDRNASYTKKTLIERLPAYLNCEMIRFFFKEKERINAKILKDVKFPMILDVMSLCTPDLQKKLSAVREDYKKMDDMLLEERKLAKAGKAKNFKYSVKPTAFDHDLGSNNSGFYELKGVITHQGRTSSSGHYVAWIRFQGDEWLKCDDDVITPVTEEEILKLSGGGDWHTAYMLLYGPRELRIYEDDPSNIVEPMETS